MADMGEMAALVAARDADIKRMQQQLDELHKELADRKSTQQGGPQGRRRTGQAPLLRPAQILPSPTSNASRR